MHKNFTIQELDELVGKLGGEEEARMILEGKLKVSILKPGLLKLVGTIEIPAIDKFIARDKFVVDTSDEAEVKIAWLGNNFKEWFLDKKEEQLAASKLCYHKLLESEVDAPIIEKLGGKDSVKITLAQLFALMKKQGRGEGEEGVLLTCGRANIAYIPPDINGVLCAVNVNWGSGGWLVNAYSIGPPYRRHAGFQVFSPQF